MPSKDKALIARMRGEAPAPLPDAFTNTLPSQIVVQWRMPDPFYILAFDGVIPDPMTAAVIDMLKAEKSYVSETDPMRHRHEAANIKGMYALAAAMLESPKLDVSLEYGDGETLGRREVGYQDVIQLYHWFRFQTRAPVSPSAHTNEPERAADAPSNSDGIRADASAANGD